MNDILKLENQLCFPLYACSKEVIKKYAPFLDVIGLTYTQYIVMMVLWDKNSIDQKSLGNMLYLDSGTLTPLLKKMECSGLIKREREIKDERRVNIIITEKGKNLKDEAMEIPVKISKCINLTTDEAVTLYKLLYKILQN